jgi:uncharacterized protein
MKSRNIQKEIEELALSRNKMAFISGPRQVGKTTIAKMFIDKKLDKYFNWDDLDFRRLWTMSPKQTTDGLERGGTLILDEIHKAAKWKQNLKGLYDTLDREIRIIVTGSARLDLYKKGSDSLMGRYLGFRLHPFTLGELVGKNLPTPKDVENHIKSELTLSASKKLQGFWNDLENYGGFPEPLFSTSNKILNVWHRGRIEKIVREDLRDLSRIPELSKIEMLISLLPTRVASPLSLTSLREDLEISYDTAKRWMKYLEQLYYHFEIKPWSKNVSRSLKKEGKMYLWDWSEIKEPGARFENMVASHLLKACHYWTDSGEGRFDLHYLKTKERKEIDFLISRDGIPWLPIECKMNAKEVSPNFATFSRALDCKFFFQLVNKPNYLRQHDCGNQQVIVCSANQFLRYFP